jgi:hypothetical protein
MKEFNSDKVELGNFQVSGFQEITGDSLLQKGLTKNNEKSSIGEVPCNRENSNAVLLNNLIWSSCWSTITFIVSSGLNDYSISKHCPE